MLKHFDIYSPQKCCWKKECTLHIPRPAIMVVQLEKGKQELELDLSVLSYADRNSMLTDFYITVLNYDIFSDAWPCIIVYTM